MKLHSHNELRYKTLKTFMDGGLQSRLRRNSRISAALRKWGGRKLLRARRNWVEVATAYGTEPNVRLVDFGPIHGKAGVTITPGKTPGSDLGGEDPVGRPNDRIDLNLRLAARDHIAVELMKIVVEEPYDEDIDEVGFAIEQDAFAGICRSTCQAPELAREELLLLEMMARRAAKRNT